eukprot:3824265-Prymnesium_polylepis.1
MSAPHTSHTPHSSPCLRLRLDPSLAASSEGSKGRLSGRNTRCECAGVCGSAADSGVWGTRRATPYLLEDSCHKFVNESVSR